DPPRRHRPRRPRLRRRGRRRDLVLPARPRLPPERGGRADDPRRGSAGHAARRADERLLRRGRPRPHRRREPRPLAPDRTRRDGPARRPAAPAVNVRLRPERGLDVAEAWFGEHQIAWLSGRGDVAWNGDWTASWGGGLVTTCGLDNVGAPS